MPHWKHLAKQQVKPLAVPVLARLDRRTQAQLAAAGLFAGNASSTEGTADTGYTLNSFKELLPGLLGVIATQHAEAREAARADARRDAELAELRRELRTLREQLEQTLDGPDLLAPLAAAMDGLASQVEEARQTARQAQDRVEFVRTETLLEVKYGRKLQADGHRVASRILDQPKIDAAGGQLRLNIGAGHLPRDGFVNVDVRELPGIDVVADVMDLPFGPGEVHEIRSEHLLEHFPEERLRRELLPYWRSLLGRGGRLTAVVPDTTTMLSRHAAGEMSFEDLRQVLFGGQEYEGDFHFTAFTQDSLAALLQEAGFAEVKTLEAGRRNGLCFEMEVLATVDNA